MKISTRKITLTAVGAALFAALSLCLQVPVFENYYLCLGYAVMAVYCYSFGTACGTAAGTLGVVVYCLVINGLRGMPGWAAGNIILGIVLGLTFKATRKLGEGPLRAAVHTAAVVAASALGILVVKSFTEVLLYGQPMAVRMAKNVYAFAADAAVLLVSLPLCCRLDGVAKKMFPAEAKG